jgi:hypothetical protein
MASKIYFLAQFYVLSKTEKSQITIGIAFKDIKEVCYGT